MKRMLILSLCGLLSLRVGSGAAVGAPSAPDPAPAATPAPPPSSPAKRSAADLEKLVAPIALYPDPLLATILPASVYPLEIVKAARLVADTNNLARLDDEPLDDNVKAVARVPDAIKKLNDDLNWTIELGEAFLEQDRDVMDAIQSMRAKAQRAGTLQTSAQQLVTVTNMIVETRVEKEVVLVTNTVVEIRPSDPQVIYVPSYPPTVYSPPPDYVYNPVAPLVSFGVGMAVGSIIANNCDWHVGGVYVGHHGVAVWGGGTGHGDVNVNIDRNVNNSFNRNTAVTPNRNASPTAAPQKWQPTQSRLTKSGASASTASRELRGWSGDTAASSPAGTRVSGGGAEAARAPMGATPGRPSTGASNRASASANGGGSGSARSGGASPVSSSVGRSPASSGGSAFGGMSSRSTTQSYSNRGATSRGGGSPAVGGGRGGRGAGVRR